MRQVLSLVALVGLSSACPLPAAAPPLWRSRLSAEQNRWVQETSAQVMTHAREGRFAEAEKLARAQVQLRERVHGPEFWKTQDARRAWQQWARLAKLPREQQQALGEMFALQNQARQASRAGRPAEAIRLNRKALAACVEAAGEATPETIECHDRVASGLKAQGKAREALPHLEKALALSRKALGEAHWLTARSYNNYALALDAVGNHANAEAMHQKAIRANEKALGPAHPQTATSYNNQAMCLYHQGKQTPAQALYQKALAVTIEAYGERHQSTATCRSNLAACLSAQGKHAEAWPHFMRALAVMRVELGDDHPSTSVAYNNVAFCLDNQGLHASAFSIYEKALALTRKLLGDSHPETATTFSNLAACLMSQGKYAEAEPLARQALAIYRAALTDRHPRTASAYRTLSVALAGQRKHEEARRSTARALAIQRAVSGEEHPDVAICLHQLGSAYGDLGEYAQAMRLYQHSLWLARKLLGEWHPTTAVCAANLAWCLERQGRFSPVLALRGRAGAINRTTLGEDHPATADSYLGVAHTLWQLGVKERAVRLLQEKQSGLEAARFHVAATGFDRGQSSRTDLSAHSFLAVGLARLNQPGNAFRHAEASLARGLLDDLVQAGTADAATVRSGYRRLHELDERLLPFLGRSDLSEEPRARRDELSRQRRSLQSEIVRLLANVSSRQSRPLEDIQKHLPSDAAFVLWLDVPALPEHWACVVRREGKPAWLRLSGTGKDGTWTAQDASLASRLYDALTDHTSTAAQRASLLAAFRKQRLDPIRPLLAAGGGLPAVRRLLVAPVGPAAHVPFEVLTDDFSISYVPSGSVFARLMERHRPLEGSSLLALGDPVFDPKKPADPPASGVLVKSVLPGGHAARAGLRAGDVLRSVGETTVASVEDIPQGPSDRPVPITYWRDGAVETARLGGLPFGAVFDNRSARAAVRAWRKDNERLTRGTGHKRLPGTRMEVEAVSSLVENTTTLLGSDASEQKLDDLQARKKLKAFRLLLIATHGEIDRQVPGRSSLILAQDQLPTPAEQALQGKHVYDGRLTVSRIRATWELDADLVVLSACETGLGKDAGGEGLLGFAQAFLQKGARCVVLSRWKVDDTATALLMVRFFENLLGKGKGGKALGRAAALDEAKRWLRSLPRKQAGALAALVGGGELRGTVGPAKPPAKPKDQPKLPAGDHPYAHPYYWAAFTLVGDPD